MKNKKLLVSIMAGLLAAIMLLTLLIGLIPTHAHAALTSEKLEGLEDQLGELEKAKDAIEKEKSGLRDQINDNMSEMEKLVAEKSAIDQEVGLLNQEIGIINEQITVYGQLIADKQEELDEAEAHLQALREQNKERIRAMEEQGSLSYWSVLFKASSFSDLLDRLNMIEEIAEADQRRLEEMNKAAEEVAAAQAILESKKNQLESTKNELHLLQEDLAAKRAEADAILVELNAKDEELDKLMAEAEANEEILIEQIAQAEHEINKEKDRLEEEERKRKEEEERKKQEEANKNNPNNNGNSTTDAQPSDASWIIPCSYVYLSSPYGYRVHPVYGTWLFHSGVDLAAPKDTPIKATRAGTVTVATWNNSAGYYVTVNHGDGFSSSYLHMTHYIVKPGDYVQQGQVIGYVGSTGTSTGNHLHFSVYYNGKTQNPAAYINFY